MEHDKYHELNTLSLYGELSNEEQSQLLHHLLECKSCLADFEEKTKIKKLISENSNLKNSDEQLLQQARRELRIALSMEKKKSFFSRLVNDIGEYFSVNYKTALAGAFLLAAGIFIGKIYFQTNVHSPNEFTISPVSQQNSAALDNTRISNVQFVDADAGDGEVEFTFEAVKPMHIKGNVNDPQVQNILTYAMINGQNPGIRLNSISMINSNQKQKFDTDVKDAIVNIIKSDPNPGVRMEALKLIKKIPYDNEIKKAMLHVLIKDENSAMRIEAINILVDAQKEGHKFSPEDINIFKEQLQEDKNQYIQFKVKTVLKENT